MNELSLREILAAAGAGLALVTLAVMSTCSPPVPLLDRVKAQGVLRIATLNSPTTYYIGVSGPTGFEYDLARGFADQLGVKPESMVKDSSAAGREAVRSGRAQVGAAEVAAEGDECGTR